MIATVSFEHSTWAHVPHKFEAGTPPIVEAIGLKRAIEWVEAIGYDAIADHEAALTDPEGDVDQGARHHQDDLAAELGQRGAVGHQDALGHQRRVGRVFRASQVDVAGQPELGGERDEAVLAAEALADAVPRVQLVHDQAHGGERRFHCGAVAVGDAAAVGQHDAVAGLDRLGQDAFSFASRAVPVAACVARTL